MNRPAGHDGVEAVYWEAGPDGKTLCRLCPFHCQIKEGKVGICGVKKNVGGRLIATAYGRTTSFNYDPIEKKPLYHFYPGTSILSVGVNGCNLDCAFCQNYQVSQKEAFTQFISPRELADAAGRDGSIGVAYTYTEPLMWYEYIIDSAKLVKERGLKTVLVTNALLEEEPFDDILPYIDAMNIDVKSMDEDYYKKICHGKLAPVLRNVEAAAKSCHVEITNLVVPTLNDSDDHFDRLASFIAELNPEIPLHFSRYHPAYKMTIPPTPADTLVRAAEIAAKKLNYVFIGNINIPQWVNSYCPHCRALLIQREGFYSARVVDVENGSCRKCGNKVEMVG
ncbi:MAG: AmmeMemoRadiSam system radical SAM enzyme [Nitrospinota bacterium]